MRYWCNSLLKRLMVPAVLMRTGSEFQQEEPGLERSMRGLGNAYLSGLSLLSLKREIM